MQNSPKHQLISRTSKVNRQIFPNPEDHHPEGLIAISEELNFELLFEAYSFGIFPWPEKESPLLWFCPNERGVLDFCNLHTSRSFKKFLKKSPFKITLNHDFKSVIKACADAPRVDQDGTWITDKMLSAYCDFHQDGYAHSIECWLDDHLVGGLYGVYINNIFSAESMFHLEDNASKVALYHLIQLLQKNGNHWMDIQMVTPFLEQLGGSYITKADFFERIKLNLIST